MKKTIFRTIIYFCVFSSSERVLEIINLYFLSNGRLNICVFRADGWFAAYYFRYISMIT